VLYLNFYYFTKTHFDTNYRYDRKIPYNHLYCLILLTAFAFAFFLRREAILRCIHLLVLILTSRLLISKHHYAFKHYKRPTRVLAGMVRPQYVGLFFKSSSNKLSLNINRINFKCITLALY